MNFRPGRRVGAILVLTALVVVIVILLATGGSAPKRGANAASYSGVATVQRRNLVSTDTESGTLRYASPHTVYNRLSGTITWVPKPGRVVAAGGTLFEIDNEPVLLMNGATPAFRDLTASDASGPDVLELNRNLVSLHDDPEPITVNDHWQTATTAGVEALQRAEGWKQSGTLALGQIVFLPGPQLIATVAGTLGSVSGGGAAPLLTTSSTQLVVTVNLGASVQSEATPGESVAVQMPNGDNVSGKVTAVSPVAESSGGGSGSSAAVPVTVTLDKRAKGAGLDEASVSVTFTQAKAKNVLSVPVTALVATAGGHFAVQETTHPYKLIHVTTGLFAAGYVQISGSGIAQGIKVSDSQG